MTLRLAGEPGAGWVRGYGVGGPPGLPGARLHNLGSRQSHIAAAGGWEHRGERSLAAVRARALFWREPSRDIYDLRGEPCLARALPVSSAGIHRQPGSANYGAIDDCEEEVAPTAVVDAADRARGGGIARPQTAGINGGAGGFVMAVRPR